MQRWLSPRLVSLTQSKPIGGLKRPRASGADSYARPSYAHYGRGPRGSNLLTDGDFESPAAPLPRGWKAIRSCSANGPYENRPVKASVNVDATGGVAATPPCTRRASRTTRRPHVGDRPQSPALPPVLLVPHQRVRTKCVCSRRRTGFGICPSVAWTKFETTFLADAAGGILLFLILALRRGMHLPSLVRRRAPRVVGHEDEKFWGGQDLMKKAGRTVGQGCRRSIWRDPVRSGGTHTMKDCLWLC